METKTPAEPAWLQTAIDLARQLHANQTDRSGAPYFEHVERVMNGVRHEGPEAMAAAVLHDSIEDAGMTRAELLAKELPEDVVTVIEAVTKTPEEENDYDAFIERVARQDGIVGCWAVAVKMSDLLDNMNLRRLYPQVTEEDLREIGACDDIELLVKRYPYVRERDFVRRKKYERAYARLKDVQGRRKA